MQVVPRSLAVLATVPGREVALEGCLRSLRPQVEQLRVICHDVTEAPAIVRELADEWRCEPDVRGSAAKLHWCNEWTGLYLGCDDDFLYPPEYVATMLRWVRRWKGRALVTCHGRILPARTKGFADHAGAWPPQGASPGGRINYPGGCAMAFDTRLLVPDTVPGKNLEEAHLAVWAQVRGVPIWLVPHPERWLGYLLNGTKVPTIWEEEKGARFANRNAILVPQSDRGGWKLHRC